MITWKENLKKFFGIKDDTLEKSERSHHKYLRKEGEGANAKYFYKDNKGKEHIKTEQEHNELQGKKKKERQPQWYDDINKKFQPNRLPIGIEKDKVQVNESGEGNWLMKWIDPKTGMQLTSYSKKFLKENAKNKWKRIQNISSKDVQGIKDTSKQMLFDKDKEKAQSAAIVNIISETGLRPGSKKGFSKTENRGVSTLAKENVKIEGDKVSFEFRGKSYKNNTAEIQSKELADYLSELIKDKKNTDFIFDIETDKVRDLFQNEISPKKGMKLKDMRTYIATDMAREILFEDKASPPPLPQKGIKKAIQDKLKEVFVKVSSQLNNSPSMAKTSYIHPNIINQWLESLGVPETEIFVMKSEDNEINDETDYDENVDEYVLPDWWDEDLDNNIKKSVDELLGDKEVVKALFDEDIIDLEEFISTIKILDNKIEVLQKEDKRDNLYADIIIKNDKGAILFLRRNDSGKFGNLWGLPGGHIDKGEKPEDAAVREAAEEVGHEITDVKQVGTKDLPNKGKIYYFSAKLKDPAKVIVLDNSEHYSHEYIDKENYSKYEFIGELIEILGEIEKDADIEDLKKNESVGKAEKTDKYKKDKQGGFVYTGDESLQKAKAGDLITLPKDIEGTNCGNCKFMSNGFCNNENIQLPVTERMCCSYWDAKGVLRSFEK